MRPVSRFAREAAPADAGEWLLFCAGVNLTLLNFILVQHVTVAFREPEFAALLFSLSYFSGISLGYLVSDRLTPSSIRRLLPVLLFAQLFILLFLQSFAYVTHRTVANLAASHGFNWDSGWGVSYVAVYILITLGATSLYSVFLPALIEARGGGLRRLYGLEVAGSILGLLSIPVLAGQSHTWLLSGYLTVFLILAWLAEVGHLRWVGMAAISIAFLASHDAWDRDLSAWFYSQWYSKKSVQSVEFTHFTPYHKIEVLGLADNRRMLVLNGKRQFAHGSYYRYAYFVAEYPARLLGNPTVCVLGCGSMATVGRIGNFVPEITIVDIDREVFATSRTYFRPYNRLDELTNWTFVSDDAKHFVANSDRHFDLIVHDIPTAYSRQVALTYTAEFFELVKQRLTPRGIFSISSLTPLHVRSSYGRQVIATLCHVFDHYFVLRQKKSVYFYGGGPELVIPDRDTLARAIDHPARATISIHVGSEVDALARGEETITIDNIGDLIFDD